MIAYQVDQASVDRTVEHLESVRLRIFAGVREAMQEGMQGLAETAVVEMGAAGIQRRTGSLAENILKSPKIFENRWSIMGRVTAKGKMKIGGREFLGFLGTALDEGYRVPPVTCAMHEIVAADGNTFWARSHVAFDVRPHPFLRPASAAYMPTLLDLIESRIHEEIDEANA